MSRSIALLPYGGRPVGRTACARTGAVIAGASLLFSIAAFAQDPHYLADRGLGIATSMFGTYVRAGELLVYPFYEYVLQDLEYKPSDLGYGSLAQDFRGRFREHESMLFIGYGVSDRLALEFESALFTTGTLRKDPVDTSGVPGRLSESGLGDTQLEARWRWAREAPSHPELFSYFEMDFPLQRHRKITGTQTWAFKLGTGAIKGFAFGTLTARAALQYDDADGTIMFGEYALDYLKRLSATWRFYAGVEGNQDEVEGIVEGQWRLGSRVTLKLNNAFGLTSKAPRWAPEVGFMFGL